jgi:hypothetical protein
VGGTDEFPASPTRLEGMETYPATIVYALATDSLRPALRGWKQQKRATISFSGIGLRPALRGWKLKCKRMGRYRRTSLRPALRGWKLSAELQRLADSASPTRLEGMETCLLGFGVFILASQSPTRLEGMETMRL